MLEPEAGLENGRTWGDNERHRLRRARTALGHSQPACIEALRALGAPGIAQPTLSQWETGTITRPPDEAIDAIARYWKEAPTDTSRSPQAEFAEVIAPITGEPMLSDRQAALVDAIIHRLGNSIGPLSPEDGLALRWAAMLIGLELPPVGGPAVRARRQRPSG